MLNLGPFEPFLLISYIGNNENPPITDEICWSIDVRYCGVPLYFLSLPLPPYPTLSTMRTSLPLSVLSLPMSFSLFPVSLSNLLPLSPTLSPLDCPLQNQAFPLSLPLSHPLTMVDNSQEYRLKYWATRSSVRSFARTAHSFACCGLLASLAPSAALTRSLARSLRSLPRSLDSELLDGYFVCVFFHFRP